MAACHRSPKEASYNYGLTPKFAELLAQIFADDLAYQASIKLGADMGDAPRPLERALNRLNFRTGLLFKPADEKSMRQMLNRTSRSADLLIDSGDRTLTDNDRDAQAGYLCFLRQVVKQSLFYIHYFARIMTGLTPTMIASIGAYNDFAVMRMMKQGIFFKPRVSLEDLTTLLMSDDPEAVKSARMRCIMTLLNDIPEEPQSMSARIQLETASVPKLDCTLEGLTDADDVRLSNAACSTTSDEAPAKNRKTFFCMSALGAVYEAPFLEETCEAVNKLERYHEPFLVHYLFMIHNHVPHARAKPFFEGLSKDAGGKCNTVNKHLQALGFNTKQGLDTGRLNSRLSNILATVYLSLYRNATRSIGRKPIFLVTAFQFFKFQVCPDLSEAINRYVEREFNITCAARLLDDIATGKTIVREERCCKCGRPFSLFGLNKPLCPACDVESSNSRSSSDKSCP